MDCGGTCDSVLVMVKGTSRSLLLTDASTAMISLQEDSAVFTKILGAREDVIHSSTVCTSRVWKGRTHRSLGAGGQPRSAHWGTAGPLNREQNGTRKPSEILLLHVNSNPGINAHELPSNKRTNVPARLAMT